jgi:hypothetical protein
MILMILMILMVLVSVTELESCAAWNEDKNRACCSQRVWLLSLAFGGIVKEEPLLDTSIWIWMTTTVISNTVPGRLIVLSVNS